MAIRRGDFGFEVLPLIRVATRGNIAGSRAHCIDNRRLFVARVLGLTSIRVQTIAWTDEFDAKINKVPRTGYDCMATTSESVADVRARIEAYEQALKTGEEAKEKYQELSSAAEEKREALTRLQEEVSRADEECEVARVGGEALSRSLQQTQLELGFLLDPAVASMRSVLGSSRP